MMVRAMESMSGDGDIEMPDVSAVFKSRRKGAVLQALLEDLQAEAEAGQTDVQFTQTDKKIVTLPEGMTYATGIEILTRRLHLDDEELEINREYNAHPYDGAHALAAVLQREFGYTSTEKAFWWENQNASVGVEISPTETRDVIWGKFKLPDTTAVLQTSLSIKPDRTVFVLSGSFKRVDAAVVKAIADLVAIELKNNSIYRGKAIQISFVEDPDPKRRDIMRRPQFLNLKGINPAHLVLPRKIEDRLDASLYTVLRNTARCEQEGVALKRGVLLHGTYGTGKTMTAYVAAMIAVTHGWTFIYARDNLAKALQFAQQYQPAMVFFEDIDRDMEERDEGGNELLEIMDGVGSKGTKVVTVLTTNNLDMIHEAALRPGRFDDIIEIEPPDAEAAIRLVRTYGAGLIAEDADLTEVGERLTGIIPAMISEIITRAKLSAIRYVKDDEPLRVNANDLLVAADSMLQHQEIMAERMRKDEFNPFEEFMAYAGPYLIAALQAGAQAAFNEGRLDERHTDGIAGLIERSGAFIAARTGTKSRRITNGAQESDED